MTFAEASLLPRVKRPSWTGFHVRNRDTMLVWQDDMRTLRERSYKPTEVELAAADWESAPELSGPVVMDP